MALTSQAKTVIIITGPTAVGKTGVAIQLAEYYQTEIISADSRQCYQELKIGIARPSEKELKQIPHYFIASHSIQEDVDAMVFEKYAFKKITEIFEMHDVALMAGGTGLYIKAFCEGMDNIPPVSQEIRKEISSKYKKHGLIWLQEEVQAKDPEFYAVGETKNPQRLMRALEIIESTGKSILYFRRGEKAKREFNIIKIGLELPKEQLHENINIRVEKMIGDGLVEEVKSLLPYKECNALQTVGYLEIIDYLENIISLEEAKALIKQNTRQYAKRQTTWFKKDEEITWFHPAEIEKIKKYLKDVI